MFLLPLVVPLENRMDCGFVSLQTGKCHGFLHQDLVQEQNRLGVIYCTVSLLSASCFTCVCAVTITPVTTSASCARLLALPADITQIGITIDSDDFFFYSMILVTQIMMLFLEILWLWFNPRTVHNGKRRVNYATYLLIPPRYSDHIFSDKHTEL